MSQTPRCRADPPVAEQTSIAVCREGTVTVPTPPRPFGFNCRALGTPRQEYPNGPELVVITRDRLTQQAEAWPATQTITVFELTYSTRVTGGLTYFVETACLSRGG